MSLLRLFKTEVARLMLVGFLVGSAAVGAINIADAVAAESPSQGSAR